MGTFLSNLRQITHTKRLRYRPRSLRHGAIKARRPPPPTFMQKMVTLSERGMRDLLQTDFREYSFYVLG